MEEFSFFDVLMRLSSFVLMNNTISIWHHLQYAVGMYLIKLWMYATLCCNFSVVQMCVCVCVCVCVRVRVRVRVRVHVRVRVCDLCDLFCTFLWTGSSDVDPPSDCCFAAGERKATCNVTIVRDSISESDEMFNIRLSPRPDQCVCNPPDGPNLKVTIGEDDVPAGM